MDRLVLLLYHFFFQAEDGIRDYKVTGVQTCALPISRWDQSGGGGDGRALFHQLEYRSFFHWGSYAHRDRKSTRLNSSHLVISYAVFCLKKKKKLVSPFDVKPIFDCKSHRCYRESART